MLLVQNQISYKKRMLQLPGCDNTLCDFGFNSKEIREIYSILEEHRQQITEKWGDVSILINNAAVSGGRKKLCEIYKSMELNQPEMRQRLHMEAKYK